MVQLSQRTRSSSCQRRYEQRQSTRHHCSPEKHSPSSLSSTSSTGLSSSSLSPSSSSLSSLSSLSLSPSTYTKWIIIVSIQASMLAASSFVLQAPSIRHRSISTLPSFLPFQLQPSRTSSNSQSQVRMVMSRPETDKEMKMNDIYASSSPSNKGTQSKSISKTKFIPKSSTSTFTTTNNKYSNNNNNETTRKRRKKYQRKRKKTPSEQERDQLRESRQREYEELMDTKDFVNVWAFESLFPEPVWDEATIYKDLYEVSERDDPKNIAAAKKKGNTGATASASNVAASASSKGRMKGKENVSVGSNEKDIVGSRTDTSKSTNVNINNNSNINSKSNTSASEQPRIKSSITQTPQPLKKDNQSNNNNNNNKTNNNKKENDTDKPTEKVDKSLTRMVEDRIYGFRRLQSGEYQYYSSLAGDGAVQFRDGVRLGNALKINADRLNYYAKKEFVHGRLEEAEELYERAIEIDPRDGRAYLGISRVAQRRRDFRYAKECLRAGIQKSYSEEVLTSRGGGGKGKDKGSGTGGAEVTTTRRDQGANPFLLQALGCLEERMGHLAEAEALFIAAAKSRPSHAAAWIALAQLRTRKLRQGANAGRMCYLSAERELKLAGLPPSSHVYTAWASLEYKKAGDVRRARELFDMALQIDPKCSAAWLQLGAMEAKRENWARAKECFETVLKYDQRNSRVLQAYALMESKRPDGDSRDVIDLFERALEMNPRDGGVFQAYALYVARLGDIDAARNLLRRGTEVDKRHAPIWQAWGVLETRHGEAEVARDVFQQGIWSCAQSSGGQSGGRRCARLWQAWGVLEAKEGDHAAARRCFSRALDADSRNVATVTAWTLMEEDLGNYKDARLIFERALKQFSSPSDEKMSLWRAFEVMESRAGNSQAAQNVYQRSIRDAIKTDEFIANQNKQMEKTDLDAIPPIDKVLKNSNEVEVVSWKSKSEASFGGKEVWMKNGSIEGKVPLAAMKKKKK